MAFQPPRGRARVVVWLVGLALSVARLAGCQADDGGGRELSGEVDPRSIIYQQGENRMHAQKAALLHLLEGSERPHAPRDGP